ncbi:MAG: hypothetical protein H6Q11_277 [Acidobacteria bacterium]|nr:hypothetical protein [Acidobacteriota bacterium]
MPAAPGYGKAVHGHRNAATPDDYIVTLAEPRRSDVQRLHDLIRRVAPRLEPTMEFRMLGYGKFHYRYASGREGDAVLVGVADNKQAISLYVMAADEGGYLAEQYAPRLGKASCGKACIRFKRLDDLDLGALEDLLRRAAALGPGAAAGPA